jgi:hypothetical protein
MSRILENFTPRDMRGVHATPLPSRQEGVPEVMGANYPMDE